MNFEYNGNKELSDRLFMVANEIVSCYPQIDFGLAINIAMLEEPITEYYNDEMHIKRLYNILFFIKDNNDLFRIVFADLKKVYERYACKLEKKEDKFYNLINAIYEYKNRIRYDFPLITDYCSI